MNKQTLLALMALAAFGGCVASPAPSDDVGDDGSGDGSDTTTSTKIVSIQVLDAVISPGKTSHEPWDGVGAIPSSVWTLLTSALGAPEPFNAVVAFFGNAAVAQLDKPDPFGSAVLFSQTSTQSGVQHTLATTSDNLEDTFQPTWPTPARWDGIPLTTDLRVQISLLDEDLSDNDPIGVVELNTTDLEQALTSNQVFHVNVADQAGAQILFVGVSVRQTGTQ